MKPRTDSVFQEGVAIIEFFQGELEETWILILHFPTIVSSTVVRPYFINLVTALTPWGCVCFHYKGDWAEWWSGSQPADKTKPFTKNILQQSGDSLYLDTWL